MSLLDLPIPPKPASFHPGGAPPGVGVRLGDYDPGWVAKRPLIKPRVIVVHTNGGGGEGNYAGAIRWSNASDSNTHAHYNLNAPTPSKNLRSDLRGIGNSTPAEKEREWGVPDSSFWSLVIETADRGYRNGGNADLGDFLYDHDELLARIIAYESIVWNIPIKIPVNWVGSGVVTHTAPWDGVYTIYKGKSCPGLTKKERVLRGDILPRAQQIKNAWTRPAPEPEPEKDEPMFEPYLYLPPASYDPDKNPVFLVEGPHARTVTGRDWSLMKDRLPKFAEADRDAVRYDLVHRSVVGSVPAR